MDICRQVNDVELVAINDVSEDFISDKELDYYLNLKEV